MLQTRGGKGENATWTDLQSLWTITTIPHVCLAVFWFRIGWCFSSGVCVSSSCSSALHEVHLERKKSDLRDTSRFFTGNAWEELHVEERRKSCDRLRTALTKSLGYLSSRDGGERVGGAEDGLVIYHGLRSHQGHWPHLAHRRRNLQI